MPVFDVKFADGSVVTISGCSSEREIWETYHAPEEGDEVVSVECIGYKVGGIYV